MMRIAKKLLAATVATALLWPAAAMSKPTTRHPATLTVHPKPKGHHWRGYGFLPGYRPQAAEALGVPIYGTRRHPREARYLDWYGNVNYGWGGPGFYRGQWNGGSFGPCWTYTPIGMMPTCGQ